jgi:hypothetical protein
VCLSVLEQVPDNAERTRLQNIMVSELERVGEETESSTAYCAHCASLSPRRTGGSAIAGKRTGWQRTRPGSVSCGQRERENVTPGACKQPEAGQLALRRESQRPGSGTGWQRAADAIGPAASPEPRWRARSPGHR